MSPPLRRRLLATAGILALAVPAAASAHVTLQPTEAPAGAFVVENVRVPNESDTASTVKVDMQLPDGFGSVSYEAKPGWKVSVESGKLTTPTTTDDGDIAEQVVRITWTGDGKTGKIGPGEFMDFPVSMRIPGKDGDELVFKVLQTYDDGKVSRWIGDEDGDAPAPIVQVTAAEDDQHASGTTTTVAERAEHADEDEDEDGASMGLGIAALALGGLGLAAGLTSLITGRRKGQS